MLSIQNPSLVEKLNHYESSLIQKWRTCKMNFNKLKFGATIGIIGGGQLGKMMAQSAQKWVIKWLYWILLKIVHVDTLHTNLYKPSMTMKRHSIN